MRILKKHLLLFALMASLLAAASSAGDAPLQLASLGQDSRDNHSTASSPWEALNPRKLQLKSATALVVDRFGNEVYAKQEESPMPIASITKLMTAMVILDSDLDLEETIEVTRQDVDRRKGTRSRLRTGLELTRHDLLLLALMASENRAAAALGRTDIGSIEVGNKADVVVVALDSVFVSPVHRVPSALVFCASPADVTHVLVDGRVLIDDRRFTMVDEAAIVRQANASAGEVFRRAGVESRLTGRSQFS